MLGAEFRYLSFPLAQVTPHRPCSLRVGASCFSLGPSELDTLDMPSEYCIRRADRGDLETLVSFALQEAGEAEAAETDAGVVRRGVLTGLVAPRVATYWVAEAKNAEVVASISAVREWSNWHAGYYWWIQSLYIVPEHRGRGLVELLLDTVAEAARAAGALDLRLYVHTLNRRALGAFRRCGFDTAPYTIMTRQLKGE